MVTLSFYTTKQKSTTTPLIHYGFDSLGIFDVNLKPTATLPFSYDYKVSFSINETNYRKAYNVIRMALFLNYHCKDMFTCLSLTSKIASAAGLRIPKHIIPSSHPVTFLTELYALNKNTKPYRRNDIPYQVSVA